MTKIKMQSISLTGGEHKWLIDGPINRSTWHDMSVVTWNMWKDMVMEGGFCRKIDFLVTFEDGTEYAATMHMQENQQAFNVGGHIMQYQTYKAGTSEGSDDNVLRSMAHYSNMSLEDYKQEAVDFLNEYEIVVIPTNQKDIQRILDKKAELEREEQEAEERAKIDAYNDAQLEIMSNQEADTSADINASNIIPKKRKWYPNPDNGDNLFNADIWKNEKIRIWGYVTKKEYRGTEEPRTYRVYFDRTFKIGDVVDVDSYNLTYTHPITKISAQNVTYDQYGTSKRLHIWEFINRNYDLDLEAIAKQNSEWYD